MDKLKSWGVWASVALTLLSLLAANGLLGSGQVMQVAGWLGAVATVLGIHVLKAPADPAPPAA